MKNLIRATCTAVYRLAVLTLLSILVAEASHANQLLLVIGQMIYKVIGGPAT
jgi:hypothetical protein